MKERQSILPFFFFCQTIVNIKVRKKRTEKEEKGRRQIAA